MATFSGYPGWVKDVAFNQNGMLASAADEKIVRLWNIDPLDHFDADGTETPEFRKIYDASFELLHYRLDDLNLVPVEPLYLTPTGGSETPRGPVRPPGRDPVEWILEEWE